MLGLGLGLQYLKSVLSVVAKYASRVLKDGGTVEAKECLNNEIKRSKDAAGQNATLAMIPSGYKGEADENNAGGFLGKVYSVLPAQTEIDLTDFSHVNVQSGDWTIDNVNETITFDGTSNGYIQLKGYANLVQPNKTYKITLTANFTGTNYPQFYDSNSTGVFLQEGTNTYEITTDNGLIRANGFGTDSWTISNISIKQVSDGDFDFSRGSDATRVNSQGYIESVQVIGEELVQNGDFEEIGNELITNGGFDTGTTGWSAYGDSTLSWDSNGYAIVSRGGNLWAKIRQSGVFTLNKIYKVTVIAKSNRNDINLHGGAFSGQSFSEVDTFETLTAYYKASEVNFDFGFAIGSGEAPVITIDNVSVKEVGQNWIFGNGWSIEDDGGNLRAVQSGGSTSSVYQNILTVGKLYKASFEITSITSGQFKIGIGENYSELYDEEGTYTYTAVATNDGLARIRPHSSTTVGTVDNFTIKEITDDTDIPRLDYSDGCPTLLLEPQRINYIQNSESFPQNGNNITKTLNALTSPDNKNNALKIEATATVQPSYQTAQADIPHGVTVTQSGFFKKGNTEWVGIGYFDTLFAADSNNYVRVNLDTLETSISGSNYSDAKAEQFTNGWVRLSAKITIPASGGTNSGFKYMLMKSNDFDDANIGDYCYIWGLQAENGSYPTSYIPTNGSAVTRLADVCNNAGDSTIFNDAEGVLYAEVKYTENTQIIGIDNGSSSEAIWIYFLGDNQLRLLSIAGGGVTANIDTGLYDVDSDGYVKLAFKYKANDFVGFMNGVKVGTDTSGATPTGLSQINFHNGANSSLFYPKANVRSLLYFNEALTDAELEKLTSSTATQVLNNYSTLLSRVGATYESSGLETKLNELL